MLRLPRPAIPTCILTSARTPYIGRLFRVTAHQVLPSLSLPRDPASLRTQKRFVMPGVVDSIAFAEHERTALLETWTPRPPFPTVDLWSVDARLVGLCDLRTTGMRELLDAACFGLAKAPLAAHRNYVAWNYLTYAIWSANFSGVIWSSQRGPGNCVALFDLVDGSELQGLTRVEEALVVKGRAFRQLVNPTRRNR